MKKNKLTEHEILILNEALTDWAKAIERRVVKAEKSGKMPWFGRYYGHIVTDDIKAKLGIK